MLKDFTIHLEDPKKGYYFPPLPEEIGKNKKYLKGKILNAGSGVSRKLDGLFDGKLTNQDIFDEPGIDIVSSIEHIPVKNNYFDSAICNAVLEHVPDPVAVVKELYRVIKPGGHLYACIPFMQPEHMNPGDFTRYTKDGIQKLMTDAGFKIVKCEGILSVYQTLSWIVTEWLNSKDTISYKIARKILYPIMIYKCKTSTTYVDSLATAYRVIAKK